MKENRPQSGVITLGGEVLSDFTTEGLMKKITRITHDSYIFKGTVRENLAMGCETASEPEMREALGQVDLLGFVEENGGLRYGNSGKGCESFRRTETASGTGPRLTA